MMQNKFFIIHDKLPSLNQVINKNRINRYVGAKYKTDIEDFIISEIKLSSIEPIGEKSCVVCIDWHEKTKKRDVDNIQSSQKFILDAMQKAGIIENDNRKHIKQVNHRIIDDTENYVIVNINDICDID